METTKEDMQGGHQLSTFVQLEFENNMKMMQPHRPHSSGSMDYTLKT